MPPTGRLSGNRPLQNRVDPFGTLHAVPERGLFTGNRGIIHDPDTRSLLSRRWTSRAWIVCACSFGGRRRQPMGRNGPGGSAGWTELFFLDEVTALAAGHRPCFHCRRQQAADFLALFGKAFHIAGPHAPLLDARLHGERLASGGTPPALSAEDVTVLPDGAMFSDGVACFTRRQDRLFQWSFAGYIPIRQIIEGNLVLLTPKATVGVLRAGYRPVWHSSATT